MKIIATSDTHYYVFPEFIPDGDVFIHAGDLMDTGAEHEWKINLNWLSRLPHKHKYFIPGNHDAFVYNYKQIAINDLRSIGFTVLGADIEKIKSKLPNGMIVGGCPFVTQLYGWPYNQSESYIKDYLDYMGDVDILVCHSPAYGYLDQIIPRTDNTGSISIGEYVNANKCKYLIHGHIHESYGYEIHPNGTRIYNVSMCNKNGHQANHPVIIEI